MPSGPVHDEQGDRSRSDASADFSQMHVHGFDVDGRQHQSGANATGWANGAEQICPGKAPVAQRARTASTSGPNPGQRALLANPCFILEPDFDLLACGALAERFLGQGCEVF